MPETNPEVPEYQHLPKLRFSKSLFSAIIAKDPDHLTDDEFKMLYLRWGYLADEERNKFKHMLTEEYAVERLGTSYFAMLDELQEFRDNRGWDYFLLTPQEMKEHEEKVNAEALALKEGKKLKIKAIKRRYQEEKSVRKRSRAAQKAARKKSRRS